MLSLKRKSQDIYLTRRELGYSVSDLAGLCNFCGRKRSGEVSLSGIGRALFDGRLRGQLCE